MPVGPSMRGGGGGAKAVRQAGRGGRRRATVVLLLALAYAAGLLMFVLGGAVRYDGTSASVTTSADSVSASWHHSMSCCLQMAISLLKQMVDISATARLLSSVSFGSKSSPACGPKATCAGCVGFATFSVLIEKFFDRHT